MMMKSYRTYSDYKLHNKQRETMAKVLTMDPETVSTKDYVEQRTVFVLTAFNSEYLAFLAYVLHAFFMLSAKMADSDSKQKTMSRDLQVPVKPSARGAKQR